MEQTKLISMVDYILEIDWMTTTEFCNKYGVPHPVFTGEVRSSADQFLQVDAVKHRMFVEYAKILNKKLTVEILTKKLAFKPADGRFGRPAHRNGKYVIFETEDGFGLEPYDTSDGRRINKVQDLINLDLTYNK